jgi:DNA-binding CsgD family transcriptional regulator
MPLLHGKFHAWAASFAVAAGVRIRECALNLTPRESQVLGWIATGKSDWQIGMILEISSKTVNYHAENLKRKFGVATRIQVVVAALRGGHVLSCSQSDSPSANR